MHHLAKQVFDLGMTINRAVAAAVQADQRGTPEALADCRERREGAIRNAQHDWIDEEGDVNNYVQPEREIGHPVESALLHESEQ